MSHDIQEEKVIHNYSTPNTHSKYKVPKIIQHHDSYKQFSKKNYTFNALISLLVRLVSSKKLLQQ